MPTSSVTQDRPWHDKIEFDVGRRKFHGYLAIPEGGDVPGILVIHAWWGLSGFFKSVCDWLAGAGFVALAPDLYNGKTASTIPAAKSLRSKMKQAIVAEELEGAVDLLSTLFAVSGDKIGVLGFSLGAYWAMWLATQRPREVAAVSLFYGLRKGNYKKSQTTFQGHFAEHDQFVSAKSIQQVETLMRTAGRTFNFHVYPNTEHWFFEKDRPDAYDPKAADIAWNRTLTFFHENLDQ